MYLKDIGVELEKHLLIMLICNTCVWILDPGTLVPGWRDFFADDGVTYSCLDICAFLQVWDLSTPVPGWRGICR